MMESLAHASRGHGADFAGIVLIVLGVVAGMGVYLDAGGPVGRGTADLVGYLVGAARVLMPILLVVLGALLVRGAPLPAAAGGDDETVVDVDPLAADHPFARNVFGGILLAIAGLGLLHLLRGAPRFDEGAEALADSAGYLGAVIGAPIRAAISPIGAGIVFVAIGFAGALVITRTTVRHVAGKTAAGVAAGARPVGRQAGAVLNNLFSLGSERTDDEDASPAVVVGGEIDLRDGDADAASAFYDQDQDPGAPGAKPKRVRKPKAVVADPDPNHPPEQLEIAHPAEPALGVL